MMRLGLALVGLATFVGLFYVVYVLHHFIVKHW